MSIGLLTEQDARAAMWSRIDSRRWWVIPWVSNNAGPVCEAIERRYYQGDASADFQLFCSPGGGAFAVAFAHKRRMSAYQLARLVIELGGAGGSVSALARMLDRQDVPI